MGFLSKALGLETFSEAPVGDYSPDVTPPSRPLSTGVTTERALGLPAVFRAIQIIAGMAAQLPIQAWRGDVLLAADKAPALVTAPDPWRPLSSWIERVVINLATDGNAFLRKHRHPDGMIASLEVLDPHRVTILRHPKTGRKSYGYTPAHGAYVELAAGDIEHVWGLEVPGLDRGLGPIAWCRMALLGVIDVRDYASTWFRDNNDVPSGVLSTDQRLDPESGKAYKRAWLNLDDDDPAKHRLGPTVKVLGHGLTYSPIALNPEDAQWIEASKAGVLDVCRMFGMPGDYLLAAVEGNSLTYSNLEMIDAQFLRTTLFPVYLRKIEAALSNVLPRGNSAKFDTSVLLRPDAKTRAEIDKLYIDAGVYDGDHVRSRDGIPGSAPARPALAPAREDVPAS